jgi:excisionase family DNA binding protein
MSRQEATRMHEQKQTMTVEEAAKLLGIGRALAYEMARTGKLPTIRFGRRLVVPRRAVERLLENAGIPSAGQS